MSSRCTTTCDRRFRLSGACILIAILVGSTQLLANQVDFSLITGKGWVQFTVGGDWKILTMDTKNPVRGAVFQIPNPADGGGPAPTNAVVMLFELDSAQAGARYAGLRQEYTKGTKSRIGVWEVFKNEFQERNTRYSGQVAYRDVADVHVCITFAWPHLPKNATGYNAEMEKAFVGMLKSVNGGLGKYPEEKGGFVRRPL